MMLEPGLPTRYRFPVFIARLAFLSVLVLATAGASARAEWVRDEVRINLRAGPGNQYKILKVLASGDRADKIGSVENWTQVRAGDGMEGWVPAGYLTEETPATVLLPEVEAKLNAATEKVSSLDAQLSRQTEAIEELESLRSENELLTAENTKLRWASTWKNLAVGGAIVLVGIIIGLVIPRGGAASRTRLKL